MVVAAFAALTIVALSAGEETASAKSDEIGVLDKAEVDCYSISEASILGMGEGSSIEPHPLYKCKVIRSWKECKKWVYISTPDGSYWKCTKWKRYRILECVPKDHSHENDF